ncbi:MAG: DoxX family protein [Bacteroidota bacterium]
MRLLNLKYVMSSIMNTNMPSNRLDIALLVYRLLISLSLINTHGLKKLLDFEGSVAHIPDPFGMGGELSTYFAIFANVICPMFIILGLFTRLAILPIVAITLSGLLLVHYTDPWPVKDVPLMYSLAFFLLLYLGPGKYSMDYGLTQKK